MSDRGIYGHIITTDRERKPCLIIGAGVPRIHHGDGLPTFPVIDSSQGISTELKDGTYRSLLAYPSHWPGPGHWDTQQWIHGKHVQLAWDAMIPCFTVDLYGAGRAPETVEEQAERLGLPRPPWR